MARKKLNFFVFFFFVLFLFFFLFVFSFFVVVVVVVFFVFLFCFLSFRKNFLVSSKLFPVAFFKFLGWQRGGSSSGHLR